jgi:protein-tyrosine phosphatase
MTDGTAPGRSLAIPSVPNLRDLGGWQAAGGCVARGRLFRSAEFSDLTGDDLAAFEALGVVAVYDLRTASEAQAQPNRLPSGVSYVALDVLADSDSQGPAMLMRVAGDPQAAEQALGGGRAEVLFEGAYRELVTLPSAVAGYRRFFSDLADGAHLPALFHCTTGKDRTGWAAAATLLLLGVDEADVRAEFLLTNDQLAPAVQPIKDNFAALGGDPALLDPVLGVRESYLAAAIDEMRSRYGDIERYVVDGLGLDATAVASLRRSLVSAD